MKTVIIALLFRVSISDFKLLNMIEYCSFIIDKLLLDADFGDAESLALINDLQSAADAAFKATKAADSKASNDIEVRNQKIKLLKKAYKTLAVHAEGVCDGDLDKATATFMRLRKQKGTAKDALQPQNVRASEGKLDGEIDGVCKSLGVDIIYVWFYRKSTDTAWLKADVSQTAKYTYTGLESGTKYHIRVQSKHGSKLSEPSDLAESRAK